MYASLGYEYNRLLSTSSTEYPVVLHNTSTDKYYLAIRMAGFNKAKNYLIIKGLGTTAGGLVNNLTK